MSKAPIESFGSELLNTLIKGAQSEVRVDCNYATAARLRLRLHQLRSRMRELDHQLYPIVAKAKVSITWDEKAVSTRVGERGLRYPKDRDSRVTLIIAPHDDDFAKLLTKAGVDAKRPIGDLLNPETTASQSPTLNLESLMFDEKDESK